MIHEPDSMMQGAMENLNLSLWPGILNASLRRRAGVLYIGNSPTRGGGEMSLLVLKESRLSKYDFS